jgi:hypothetical protein
MRVLTEDTDSVHAKYKCPRKRAFLFGEVEKAACASVGESLPVTSSMTLAASL